MRIWDLRTKESVGSFYGPSVSGKKFIYAPVSEHITHQRALQGPYKLVEEVCE